MAAEAAEQLDWLLALPILVLAQVPRELTAVDTHFWGSSLSAQRRVHKSEPYACVASHQDRV